MHPEFKVGERWDKKPFGQPCWVKLEYFAEKLEGKKGDNNLSEKPSD
jgi:hypothetical protein